MPETVRDQQAMLAAMNPALGGQDYVFCAETNARKAAEAAPQALGTFRDAEGLTLILERGTAEALGFDVSRPMQRIVLQVDSVLDGVGLTPCHCSLL